DRTRASCRNRARACHLAQARAHDGRRRDGRKRAGQRLDVHGETAGQLQTLTSGVSEFRPHSGVSNVAHKMRGWRLAFPFAHRNQRLLLSKARHVNQEDPMPKIIDTADTMTSSKLSALKKAGVVEAIIRYDDRRPRGGWKQIHPAEAKLIRDAGLRLWIVYEDA